MGFDVGIAVCGPNEALVISGMCYVSNTMHLDAADVDVATCRVADPST